MGLRGRSCAAEAPVAGTNFGRLAVIDQPCWYAIHTYPQNEKKVAAELCRKGIETFLPLTVETHQWSDRKKRVELPLFPGYAFVRIPGTPDNFVRVLQTGRVLRLLGVSRETPTPIPESEIESTRILVSGEVPLTPHVFLQAGRKVRICGGSLDGVEGVVAESGEAAKLVVSVNLIRQSVALGLRGYRVEVI
jgi:transcription antitermination factor NusG